MTPAGELYPRSAGRSVQAALADTRVVVLNGARQTGKSTLASLVASDHPGADMRYLDDAATRAAAESDPTRFVRHDGLLIIDEVQRVPELLLSIKDTVDRDPRPGRFLLTGSARLFALDTIPDLLPAGPRPSNSGRSHKARSAEPRTCWSRRRSTRAPI